MKARHLPTIGSRYWGLMILASVFGANTGDFCAERLGFGHVAGLPLLLGCLLLIAAGERVDRRPHEGWFWLAAIVTHAAATNVGAIGHDLHSRGTLAVGGLALLLVATLACWHMWRGRRRPAPASPAAHPLYWWTMLVAGALGTAMGDDCAWGLGFGSLRAALLLAVPVALALLALRGCRPVPLAGYWAAVVEIRAAATAAADFFADGVFGLGLATLVSGVAFGVALVATRIPIDGGLRSGEPG